MSYTYDLLGRMTGASQSGHALSFSYDALGRNLDQTAPGGTMASTFDLAGRRTRLTWPDSFYVDYDYLTTGEMKAVRANGATSGADVLATFGYDDLGRRSSLTRGDGSVASYGYDAVSRLTQLADNLVGTASDQTIGLAYNPAGQIVSRAGSNDSYSFVSYVNGTIGSTANGLNQLATLGSASPTHDARGNMTSDGASAFTYSSENLLTSATGSSTLAYDPLMRLSRWLENGAGRRNLYDGQHLALETDDNGNVRSRHIFGPGVDEPLVTYSGTGTTAASAYHLHADERGSVTAASRGSDGSVPAINKYDEYGMPGPLPRFGRYRYTGQAFYGNLGTGLYDYKARWYHPGVGRFNQTDTIGYGGGMNLYGYVGADPVNYVDPLGLQLTCGDPQRCLPDGSLVVVGTRIPGTGATSGSEGSAGQCGRPRPQAGFQRSACTAAPAAKQATRRPVQSQTIDVCNSPLPDGSTVNRNVDLIKHMLEEAEEADRQLGTPYGTTSAVYGVWIGLVAKGGFWDHKSKPGGSEPQGNINYGATGSLLFSLNALLRAAGAVQDHPAPHVSGHPWDLGKSQYGDQAEDIPYIKLGARQCKGTQR